MFSERGPPLRREEGLTFLSSLLHRNYARVCPHSNNVQVRAFTLYGPYTFGHHTIMNNICVRYTDDPCDCTFVQQVMP
jgi:hypothetical protein